MWYIAPRVPYADCWRFVKHFLDSGFPRDILTPDNGHYEVLPNLVRVAELRLFAGGQLLQIVVGISLVLATMAQMWRMICMDNNATAGPPSLLFAAISIFWLGNVRALGHGNESVHAYLVTLCLVTGIRALSQPESSHADAMRHAAIAAGGGIVAALSFGSGIACFAAFTYVLAMRRAHWPQWLVVMSGMMAALVVSALLGNAGVSVGLAPVTQVSHVVRWLAGPFVYALWPLLDPAISAQIPFAAVRVPAQLVAQMTEGLFGPVMLARWPHLLIGFVGLLWLAIATWQTWRRPSPTALLGSAMAWFALSVGALIALVRLEYLRLYPDQLLAPRYVVWSSLFWAGLGIVTVVQWRRPARAAVFAVLVGFALLPSHVWMGKLGVSVRHVAEQTALAATVGVIEPDQQLGESVLNEVTGALPQLRDARVEMFAWPETHWLGQRLPPEDVEFFVANKLQVVHGLLVTLAVIIIPIVVFAANRTQERDDPQAGLPERPPHTDHTALLKGPYKSGSEVTQACLECHEQSAFDLMKTAHWTWESQPVEVPGHNGLVTTIGKKNQINNFCIGTQGNEKKCMSCHAGYGWQDDSFDFQDPANVDCLICHANTDLYAKGDYGYPAEGIDLAAAAQSVRRPDARQLRLLPLRRWRRQRRQARRPGRQPDPSHR